MFALLRGLRCSLEARFIIARFLKNASVFFKKIEKIKKWKECWILSENHTKTAHKDGEKGTCVGDNVIRLIMETPVDQAASDERNA